MARIRILIILMLSVQVFIAGAQDLTKIKFYADVLINASAPEHRSLARKELKSEIVNLLAMPGSSQISFDSVPWLSVVRKDDLKVVTWPFRESDTLYYYDGFIQKGDQVIWLQDTRPFVNGGEYSVYTPDAWYGCLYYDIVPFKNDGKTYYALLGFHAEDRLYNRKIIEILDMNGATPKFGLPVFTGPDRTKNRILLKYADASTVHIRYDKELNAFVHDHLVSLQGVGPNGEALPVSDGSLEAWKYTKGNWEYQEKVYDIKVKDPPMLDANKDRKEEKDILGRPKSNSR